MSYFQGEAQEAAVSLPAVRPTAGKDWIWIISITVAIFAGATIYDWTQPPQQQISVALYERTVMDGYRLLVKPYSDKFVHCRFYPTCSHYSEEAMLTHGFPKGLWLTTSRLFRCMPWVKAGTPDPVPRS